MNNAALFTGYLRIILFERIIFFEDIFLDRIIFLEGVGIAMLPEAPDIPPDVIMRSLGPPEFCPPPPVWASAGIAITAMAAAKIRVFLIVTSLPMISDDSCSKLFWRGWSACWAALSFDDAG